MVDYPSTPSTTQNTATSLKRTYPPPKKKRSKGREQRLAIAGGK